MIWQMQYPFITAGSNCWPVSLRLWKLFLSPHQRRLFALRGTMFAFVIRPFGIKITAGGDRLDFELISAELIQPCLYNLGISSTTGDIIEHATLREDMLEILLSADLVICDISIPSANVFYQLGVRHALRKRGAVLIRGDVSEQDAFDLLTDRYLAYNWRNPASSQSALTDILRATQASARAASSPIFQVIPDLREIDPSLVQVLPSDFCDEVRRARSARAAGWLRLLAQDVQGLRIQRQALPLIAQSQKEIGDYEGARESWERVHSSSPHEVRANLELAKVCGALFRKSRDPAVLYASDQALNRVLSEASLSSQARIEALTLSASNKTQLWRLEWQDVSNVAERREKAVSSTLKAAYEGYKAAFSRDLNSWRAGLAALRLATILKDLSSEESWEDVFESNGDIFGQASERLVHLVSASLEGALAGVPSDHPDHLWLEISSAELQFLVNSRPNRVIRGYSSAIRRSDQFVAAAAIAPLQLFADLGIKAELAQSVIAAISGGSNVVSHRGPLHVLIFASESLDKSGGANPQFPLAENIRVGQCIEQHLTEIKREGQEFIGYASAAPGAELLFHEASTKLGISTKVCLPVPVNAFAQKAFTGAEPSWQSRFLSLVADHEIMELSDREGQSRWLLQAHIDPMERFNRWLLLLALSAGADRITLLAFWNGKLQDGQVGGIADLVRLAREAGTVEIRIVNPAVLTEGAE
jgi:hypothetical protein